MLVVSGVPCTSQVRIINVLSYIEILTHWGRVTHICVGNRTIIGSENGLLPGQCQAIIWTNAGILLIGPLGTNFSEILIEILTFSFKKMCLKVSSAKWRPFCLGLSVLKAEIQFNLLWSSDLIWHQMLWSILVQVMAWCLRAPNHYLNQCWLIITHQPGLVAFARVKFYRNCWRYMYLSLIWFWKFVIFN